MQDPKSNSSVATKTKADSSSLWSLVIALNTLAVTAYGLTLAGFLMLSGRVGDISGHKKLFIIDVLLFSLASFTGGFAHSEIVLILARVIQGMGAAMASATGPSILVTAFLKVKKGIVL
jgi:MFS family permease